jgi:hypothetical protein|tara:strand:+ start:8558 stop:8719 length:162 start_codon:yes stop_codon:yes gene_type:complete
VKKNIFQLIWQGFLGEKAKYQRFDCFFIKINLIKNNLALSFWKLREQQNLIDG